LKEVVPIHLTLIYITVGLLLFIFETAEVNSLGGAVSNDLSKPVAVQSSKRSVESVLTH